MRCLCPHCRRHFWQARNTEGALFCRQCHRLFVAPPEAKVPPWVLGVVVILMANWQIMAHHSAALAVVRIERQSPDFHQGRTPVFVENAGLCDGGISPQRSVEPA